MPRKNEKTERNRKIMELFRQGSTKAAITRLMRIIPQRVGQIVNRVLEREAKQRKKGVQ